jgi:molybdopterin/thiamine biosynthesis adenylyltransferase
MADWFNRNIGVININQQKFLFSSKVLVCGVGGVGGICNELLVRAGIGNLATIDFDSFELTNLNRQIHSTLNSILQPKLQVLKQKLLLINPKLKFKEFNKKLEPKTFLFYKNQIKKFKPQLIVDAFDNPQARVLIYRIAKSLSIPYLYCACTKANGIVCLFLKSSPNLEKLLNLPSYKLNLLDAYKKLSFYPTGLPAWGPTTNLVGALGANAALNFLLKNSAYPLAPNFWSVNGQDKQIVKYLKF